jgi:glycogen synthase kinase 3 beta
MGDDFRGDGEGLADLPAAVDGDESDEDQSMDSELDRLASKYLSLNAKTILKPIDSKLLPSKANSLGSSASGSRLASGANTPNGLILRKKLGEGSFGAVYLAKLRGEDVAVKVVQESTQFENREVAILRNLKDAPHPNIVRLIETFKSKNCTNIVMEYMPYDLHKLMSALPAKSRLARQKVIFFAYQLLRALAHIHGMGIAHRDLKPPNILVDPQSGVLKLADFGSAKKLVNGQANTTYITSRFYRAPEAVLDNQHYTTKIDIWAFGCILTEMLTSKILFTGADQVDQLVCIVRKRGSPTVAQLMALNPHLHGSCLSFAECGREPKDWGAVLAMRSVPSETEQILESTLAWVPSDRSDAINLLALPYFDAVRMDPPLHIEGVFDFTEYEVKHHESLLPQLSSVHSRLHRRRSPSKSSERPLRQHQETMLLS